MKRSFFILLVLTLLPRFAPCRDLPAFVTSEWLAANLDNPVVVVLDIRSADLYKNNHIPGALNAPFAEWVTQNEGLLLELPSDAAVQGLLGKLGISVDSLVVVVNKTDTEWNRADATRVAWTCISAGIRNTSVLDGGVNRWLKLRMPLAEEGTVPTPVAFRHPLDHSSLIEKEALMQGLRTSIIVDARTPEDYFGITDDSGHIPGARNLPAPWIYSDDGTVRNVDELKAMAEGVVGKPSAREIVVYCQVGGFASTAWFLLSEVLRYPDVRIYDGSFQQWLLDPKAPVIKFRWE
jgi:thiosulfate/3-mercaptopyruvate sulfurtransferase